MATIFTTEHCCNVTRHWVNPLFKLANTTERLFEAEKALQVLVHNRTGWKPLAGPWRPSIRPLSGHKAFNWDRTKHRRVKQQDWRAGQALHSSEE
ncbi:hypothetical protein N7468_006008 [Penicillium chermesinum]|uniref:Uncharacterized protein n=1 Tax=Penicillium chermesinum TaxID=63820 RepID=A0A9W9P2P8_9EURO|nr:uncharacterized protein N7468_006008 [Penicillium chermesinum]KAJ5233052.1 hypothetical protein N7468_006008 [Penicillium chermesinum]